MGINLQKGQRIDLTKGRAGLSKLIIGLGWDPVQQGGGKSGGGILGSLFGGGRASNTPNIDCDASVLMLDGNGKLTSKEDVIFFQNLKSRCGSVMHSGDNLTGDGDGDDEQIVVELSKIPAKYEKIVFLVNIYDCKNRNQHFGMIQNAFIRAVDASNGTELLKYNLSDNYSGKTCLFAGEIYRRDGEWKFAALGEATEDPGIGSVRQRYI